jgi:RNA polymerase sigma-70 factor, ECF subfamily
LHRNTPFLDLGSVWSSRKREMHFETLVREHQRMVFSIAHHLLRDRSEAEDVSQEVFLQLHQELTSLDSPAHAVAWLRRVTCHRAIDRFRVNAAAQARLRGVEATPVDAPGAPAGDPLLSDFLSEQLAILPEAMRVVLVLRYTEDLGPKEIAETLGIPLNTVKSTLRRALNRLRGEASSALEEAEA